MNALVTATLLFWSVGQATGAQDVVFFGEKRPWLVRLQILVNGQPLSHTWDEFAKQLFTFADRDGNGSLNQDELRQVPLPQFLFSENSIFSGETLDEMRRRVVSMRAVDAAPADGKVTPQELMVAYRQFGGGPFQLEFGQRQGPATQTVNDPLFQFVDANEDGRWSKEELAAAARRFDEVDFDENEVLSSAELLGEDSALTMTEPNAQAAQMAAATTANETGPFLIVAPGTQSVLRMRRHWMTHYGPADGSPGSRTLARTQTRMGHAFFDDLDANKDGIHDASEIDKFVTRPADVELIVRLGDRRPGEPAVELGTRPIRAATVRERGEPGAAPRSLTVTAPKETVVFELESARFELEDTIRYHPATIMTSRRISVQMDAKEQFKKADKDSDGRLDEKEAGEAPLIKGLFSRMDRDADKKLTEKEILAYLEGLEVLQSKAVLAVATAVVRETQSSFFDLLDANRDGRLTMREVRGAADKLSQWDGDGDGYLGRNELIRIYRVSVGRGVRTLNIGTPPEMAALTQQPPQVKAPTAGPLWFRKMDRNQDGDVSRREFLGGKEAFQRLDADGDGLISLAEAEKAAT